jgi:hypothetical protein
VPFIGSVMWLTQAIYDTVGFKLGARGQIRTVPAALGRHSVGIAADQVDRFVDRCDLGEGRAQSGQRDLLDLVDRQPAGRKGFRAVAREEHVIVLHPRFARRRFAVPRGPDSRVPPSPAPRCAHSAKRPRGSAAVMPVGRIECQKAEGNSAKNADRVRSDYHRKYSRRTGLCLQKNPADKDSNELRKRIGDELVCCTHW